MASCLACYLPQLIVGNAEEALKAAHAKEGRAWHYQARGFGAEAIVEGLHHFGLAPPTASVAKL